MILQEDPSVDLDTPTGAMRTYVYRPVSPGRYPGLVLFSEIFQQTGPIKRTAAILAGHGFVVAVPEIFHDLETPGCVIPYDTAGADKGNADKIGRPVTAYDDDARAVIRFLLSHPACNGKLGSIGICIGGHLSFRASMNPEILAGVCFYATDIHKGSLGKGGDDTLARMKELRAEMLMIWGRQDPHIPNEGRALIQKSMIDAGVLFSWHEFNGAHAFLRDEGPRYDPALAHICHRLAIDLFKRKLTDGDLPVAAAGGGETEALTRFLLVAAELIIRDARKGDAQALLGIYTPFVTDTAVSFELVPPTRAEFEARIASAQSQWAWLVADRDGEVAGYAYASAFRTRAAYRFTVETSAYVHPGHRGQGVARALYLRLFEVLIAKGYCNAYAGIALPNDPSIAFHKSLGFSPVGVFHRGGWKFGKWHDISWWEVALQDRPPGE